MVIQKLDYHLNIQGGPVLNVNNPPMDSQSKNKLTCIMSVS